MSGAAWSTAPRDVVAVRGIDAVAFLQGQCSQDVARLGAGASAWTFVLQPNGKLGCLARATRLDDHTVVLDVDAGAGPELLARLQRFKLRVKAELDLQPAWVEATEPADAGSVTPTEPPVDGAVRVVGWWGQGAAWLCPPGTGPAGAAPRDDRERIACGWPVTGAEVVADMIPAECGVVPVAVSFTKGCYTGQELVARIDSRGGNAPRRLCRLRATGPLAPGDRLEFDGADIGWVTSVAAAGDGPDTLALGYVARAVSPGAVVHAGSTAVTVLPQRPEAAADPTPQA